MPEDMMCEKHATEKMWATCWDCGGEGFTHHDCGDDTCVCLWPEDNMPCGTCGTKGGYYLCPVCSPKAEF
jgi:hypothetical protein